MDAEKPLVLVRVDDPTMGRALARRICQAIGQAARVLLDASPEEAAHSVVVTTDHSLTPPQCAEMTSSGARVVVLTALPSPAAESSYRSAGVAAYLPMALSVIPLLAAITDLLQ